MTITREQLERRLQSMDSLSRTDQLALAEILAEVSDPGPLPVPEQPAKEALNLAAVIDKAAQDFAPAAGTGGKTRAWVEKNVFIGQLHSLNIGPVSVGSCSHDQCDRIRAFLSAAIDAAAAEARAEGFASRQTSADVMRDDLDRCKNEIDRLNAALAAAKSVLGNKAELKRLATRVFDLASKARNWGPAGGFTQFEEAYRALYSAINVPEQAGRDEAKANLGTIRRLADEMWELVRPYLSNKAYISEREKECMAVYSALVKAIDHHASPPAPGETAEAYAERAAKNWFGYSDSPSRRNYKTDIAAAFTAGFLSRPAAAKPDAERLLDGEAVAEAVVRRCDPWLSSDQRSYIKKVVSDVIKEQHVRTIHHSAPNP